MVEGWEKRLSAYIVAMKNTSFEWGVNDCILFAAKGYEIIHGIDYYSQYLPYSTEEEAKEILKNNGGFKGIISKSLGSGHKNFLKAKRGDPVLMKIPNYTCGLVDDTGQFIIAPGKDGMVRYPINKATWVWSR